MVTLGIYWQYLIYIIKNTNSNFMSFESPINKSVFSSLLSFERIAKISFFLYIFFIFFGTAAPFQEEVGGTEEITTSNPVRQIVFTTIYLLALISLIPTREKLFKIIKEEKFLFIFLIWTLLSMFWSGYPDITFKRWMQIFGSFAVLCSGMIYLKNPEELLKYFKVVLYLYITLSFLTVFTIPGATQAYQGENAWRGLASHKNSFGQITLVSSLIWVFSFTQRKSRFVYMDYFMFFISIVLLVGSKSTTALLSLLILLIIISLSTLNKKMNFGGIEKYLISFTVVTLLVYFIISLTLFPQITDLFFSSTGKDPTFTGRTDLWFDVLSLTYNKLLYGFGYGAFWVVDSFQTNYIYSIYIWMPEQSHNGYIDVLLEDGLIGLMLLVIMLFTYFVKYSRYKINQFWKYFVITAIVLNIQESSFFRTTSMVGILFMFSYLALNSEIALKKKLNV